MRIVVFSDLHGNPYACQALLAAIQNEGPLDAIAAAGDICLGGSDPAGCVEMLQAAQVVCVYGNTEEYLYHPERMPNDEPHRRKWDIIDPAARWTLAQLQPGQFEWLRAFPFERRFSPTGKPQDDLLVVHANPRDIEMMIYPPLEDQLKLWKEVRQPDDDPALVHALSETRTGVLAFGHFHYAFQRRWRDLQLVNVACASMPGIDHDRRARYTLFTWQASAWHIEQRWITYDVQREIDALQRSDMPEESKASFLRYFDTA